MKQKQLLSFYRSNVVLQRSDFYFIKGKVMHLVPHLLQPILSSHNVFLIPISRSTSWKTTIFPPISYPPLSSPLFFFFGFIHNPLVPSPFNILYIHPFTYFFQNLLLNSPPSPPTPRRPPLPPPPRNRQPSHLSRSRRRRQRQRQSLH